MKTPANYSDYTAWDLALDDDFVRWVKNPDTKDEAFWRQFLLDHPEKAGVINEARALLLHYSFVPAATDAAVVEDIWQRVQDFRQQQASRPVRRLAPYWQYAAAVLVLLMAGFFSYRYFNPPLNLVATGPGEMRRVTFADGSQILLNQQSSLRYNSRHPYTVRLEGEAYFTVQKHGHAPAFTVRCMQGDIQVLGTSFNVNTQAQQLKVVLEQGAVQVVPLNRSIAAVKMQPGEMVVMDSISLRRKRVNTQWHTAWRNNQLIFTDAPLEEIFTYLADTQGWHFNIDEQVMLSNKRFNGTAPANAPALLLQKLSTIYQLTIIQRADTVFIEKKQ